MPAAAAPAVILASKSPTRARLLHAAGVAFTQAEALVDEADMRLSLHAAAVPVEDAAVALAELKAAQVATWAPDDAIVVGADQLLEVEGEWLEKPASLEAARRQLERLRGRRHQLVSGVVAFRGGSRIWHHVDVAELWLRPLTDDAIARYLAAAGAEVMGCVGAYQLEGLGAQLMAQVEGDYFTILGLPLLPLLQMLRDQGVLER